MKAVYHLLPLLSLLAVHGAWLNPFREAVNEANALYATENYDDAAQGYIEAAGVYAPESSELRVNLGNTLYAAGDYVRAASEYAKVHGTGQPTLDSNGLYGLGNARFQQEDYQGAIDVYERALDLTPDDEDVKYNLEVARIRLKELLDKMKDQAEQKQEEQQQGDQQQEQQDQEQQDQEQQGEQEQDEQQQQGQQEQQEQEQDGDEEQEGQSGQEESTPTPTPAEAATQGEESKPEDEDSKQSEEQPEDQDEQMTQAQVQRFLDAMERDEKRRRADKRQEQSQGVHVEKDW